jgi:hypothetical protein
MTSSQPMSVARCICPAHPIMFHRSYAWPPNPHHWFRKIHCRVCFVGPLFSDMRLSSINTWMYHHHAGFCAADYVVWGPNIWPMWRLLSLNVPPPNPSLKGSSWNQFPPLLVLAPMTGMVGGSLWAQIMSWFDSPTCHTKCTSPLPPLWCGCFILVDVYVDIEVFIDHFSNCLA